MISREESLALYKQVAKDEKVVKEVLSKLKFHPLYLLSVETLETIWDGLLRAANEFHMAVIRNPLSNDLRPKALLVSYYRKFFFNNIVYRKIYCEYSYLPDLSVYFGI